MVLSKRRTAKKREKTVNVSLFTVRHVFVGFVEGGDCGIRNAEFATLSMSLVGAYFIVLYFFNKLKLNLHYNIQTCPQLLHK